MSYDGSRGSKAIRQTVARLEWTDAGTTTSANHLFDLPGGAPHRWSLHRRGWRVGDRVPAPGLHARTRNTRSRSTNRRSSHAAEHQLAGSETPRHPTPVLSERHRVRLRDHR